MSELSLEQLDAKLDGIQKLSNDLSQQFMAMTDKDHDDKDAATKKAEKEEEEKMNAKRAVRDAAIKIAMEEKDEDKKDAAMRKAMDDMDDKKHDANDHETKEDKETKEHVAAIIEDSKKDLQVKILQASLAINPATAKSVEDRVKTASLTELKTEWSHIKPFIGGTIPQTQTPQTQVVIPPYIASYQNAADVDKAQLTAASPPSDFVNIPTKELLGDDL